MDHVLKVVHKAHVSLLLLCSRLQRLPAAMSELHQLRRLDLSFNLLQGLPTVLGGLTSLVSLALSDNPWTDAWMQGFQDRYMTVAPVTTTRARHAPAATLRPHTAGTHLSATSAVSGGYTRLQLRQRFERGPDRGHTPPALFTPRRALAGASVKTCPRGDIAMWRFLGGRMAPGSKPYPPPTALEQVLAGSRPSTAVSRHVSPRGGDGEAARPSTGQSLLAAVKDGFALAGVDESADSEALGAHLVATLLSRAAANLASSGAATAEEIAALVGSVGPAAMHSAHASDGANDTVLARMAAGVWSAHGAGLTGHDDRTTFNVAHMISQLAQEDNPDRFQAAPLEVRKCHVATVGVVAVHSSTHMLSHAGRGTGGAQVAPASSRGGTATRRRRQTTPAPPPPSQGQTSQP